MRRAVFSGVTLLALIIAAAAPALAAQEAFNLCGDGKRVTCVVDGDTFWLQGEKIRIANIDTPELGKPSCIAEMELASRATGRLVDLLNAHSFAVHREGLDRYGRTLATLRTLAEDTDLGDVLIAEGLARPWGGRRESWC